MDNSISDILASVTRAHADSASFASDTQKQDDLQFLTRVWIAERAAPELLPYPAELMERVMDRLRKQVRTSYMTSSRGNGQWTDGGRLGTGRLKT